MFGHLALAVLLLESFAIANYAVAQTTAASPSVTAKQKVRVRTLDLTHVEPLVGMPASTVVGYPEICSSEGDIFSEVYAESSRAGVVTFPDIFSVSETREVKKVPLKTPTDFKVMSLRSLFPASHQVVGLIQASQPKEPSEPVVKGKLTPFLSVTDRISGSQNLIKLDLAFQPIKAAVFASGEFLVLGVEIANMLPVVAILNADGSLKKVLDIDPRDYAASEELKKIHAVRPGDPSLVQLQRLILGSLNNAQFVPWGEQILLVQSGSTLPIYRFRDSGQLASVPVNLPDGSLLDTVLGSSDTDSWVLLTKDPASFQDIASGKVVENAPQSLFEVNPLTGEIIDQLVVTGPHPGEVHCAAHKKLTTTYYGLPQKQDVPDQLTYASAPR